MHGRLDGRRSARLARVLAGSGLLASEELPGTAAAIVEAVRGLGREGVIAKRKDSLYEPGKRSDAWQKLELEKFFSVLLMKDATTRQGFRRKDSWLQVVAISRP